MKSEDDFLGYRDKTGPVAAAAAAHQRALHQREADERQVQVIHVLKGTDDHYFF